MDKIVSLSRYGFRLNSLKNDWVSVDKSLLNHEVFKSLEKGMSIEIVGKNKEGFVTDFRIVKPLDSPKHEDSRARDILKGQCLNIVFNSMLGSDLGFDKNRETGIRIAQRLFNELEEANYYNW